MSVPSEPISRSTDTIAWVKRVSSKCTLVNVCVQNCDGNCRMECKITIKMNMRCVWIIQWVNERRKKNNCTRLSSLLLMPPTLFLPFMLFFLYRCSCSFHHALLMFICRFFSLLKFTARAQNKAECEENWIDCRATNADINFNNLQDFVEISSISQNQVLFFVDAINRTTWIKTIWICIIRCV